MDERPASRWRGLILAGASLVIVLIAVWYSWSRPRLDLLPDPDGPDYMAGAVSLADGEGYSIHLAGQQFPPRYPFGYSLTMVPLLWLGIEPAMAPLVVSFVSALVLLCLVWAGARASGGRTSAGLALLLLATTPGFLILARTPMADLTSACLVTASVLALARFYQWRTFGHPLSNGYSFWLPELGGFFDTFQVGNLPGNLRYLARDALQLEWKRTVATMYGDGSYFSPASLLLLLLCGYKGAKTAALPRLALGLGAYVLVMWFYFFPDARFHAPILVLVPIFVGPRVVEILRTGSKGWRVLTLALLCMHVLGFPGPRSTFATPHLVFGSHSTSTERFDLVDRLRTEPAGLVFSAFSEPCVRGLLGRDWVVAPALAAHGYGTRPDLFTYCESERVRQLQEFVAQSKPIYVIASQDLQQALDSIQMSRERSWRILASQDAGGGVARLVVKD